MCDGWSKTSLRSTGSAHRCTNGMPLRRQMMRSVTLALVAFGAFGLGCAPATMGQGGGGRGGPGRFGGGRMGGFDATATRYINPGTMAGLDGFTHAVRVGQMVYVSGEVALDSMGNL